MKRPLLSVVFSLFFASTVIVGSAAPAFADDMPTFQLVARGGHYYPETIEVPANTRFRLTVKNEGPGATEFESIELKKEKVLGPGASSNLIFYPLKPGSYKFFDDFHPTTAQGLIVAK